MSRPDRKPAAPPLEDMVAANLAALGVSSGAVGRPAKERIFDAFVELMRTTGKLATYSAAARRAACSDSNVARVVPILVAEGRGFMVSNNRTGKQTFLPKVT